MSIVDPGINLGGGPTLGSVTPPSWAGGGTPTTPGGGAIPGQDDAFATLQGLLNEFNLSSLIAWAKSQLVNGRSANEIALDLPSQQAYKDRFAGLVTRQANGLPAMSPAEYIAYENQLMQQMRQAGFPVGFYGNHDTFESYVADVIGKNVSLSEEAQRIGLYQQAAYNTPVEVRDYLRSTYGVDEGGLAAYYANPDRALPILQQQFTAAQIGGQAQRQQFGPLTQTEAERLAALGVTDQAAAQGFGQVSQAAELFQQLPGESPGGPGRQQALGLVAGDVGSLSAVDAQARRRKAPFAGGGGFASSQTGLTGLGSAAS